MMNASLHIDLETGEPKAPCTPGPDCLSPTATWNRARKLATALREVKGDPRLNATEKRRRTAVSEPAVHACS